MNIEATNPVARSQLEMLLKTDLLGAGNSSSPEPIL